MPEHLMVLPTLNCPASCAYCFGPRLDGGVMPLSIIDGIIRWQSMQEGRLELTFHGGEPLAAGIGFYKEALPRLRNGLKAREPILSMQSNLWLMDDETADLLREYGVSLGTSLDGPEDVNDSQRGNGYFRRTMDGIERARRHGITVGCICTVTSRSAGRLSEIFDFFAREDLNFSLHASLPAFAGNSASPWPLSAGQHGEMLTEALSLYLDRLDKVRVGTLDSMCRSLSAGQGGICTFTDCLGRYPAVGPDGNVFTCQRFAALPEYAVASVADQASLSRMNETPFWRLLEDRQTKVKEECGDCAYFDACRGGCPYGALTAGRGSFSDGFKDPHCEGYQRFFRTATEKALEEVFSQVNMDEVVKVPGRGLLRRGRLSTLMRGGPHPRDTVLMARGIAYAAALGMNEGEEILAERLEQAGLPRKHTVSDLGSLKKRLGAGKRRNNLYLHLTYGCNLHCEHCYAEAGPERLSGDILPAERVVSLCREAARLGFRQAVLTGGEPLTHPGRALLLAELNAVRKEVKPMRIVLRTNLALPLSEDELFAVGHSCDRLCVSIDGDKATHDARRGEGSYDKAVGNVRTLLRLGCDAELTLAATMAAAQAAGAEGRAVRELAGELGIRRVTFNPVKPIGRAAASMPERTAGEQISHLKPEELRCYGFTPAASCGVGENLSVEPSGDAYPCNVLCGKQWRLGNVMNGLESVLETPEAKALRMYSVDCDAKCGRCALRYLCGGGCRAFVEYREGESFNCEALYGRAKSILGAALEQLGVSTESWLAAGLPLPDCPPAPGPYGGIL